MVRDTSPGGFGQEAMDVRKDEGSGGAEQQKSAEAQAPEQLHPQLQELWNNAHELVDIPPREFFHAADDTERDELIAEYTAEMIRIARKDITPDLVAGITDEVSEPTMQGIEALIRNHLGMLREYVIDKIVERRQERYHDELTGGLSKAGLEQRFHTELKRLNAPEEQADALKAGRVMVLIEFDIDGFKGINEFLGHAGADRVMVELVTRLQSVLSGMDSVGRRSGDEMSIILNDVDPEHLNEILQRITATANEIEIAKTRADGMPETHGNLGITGSARVIEKGEDVSYKEVSEEADLGATHQKIEASNRITVYSPDSVTPDLSTYAKRFTWAEKSASAQIKRAVEREHVNLRRYEPGSDEYVQTLQQIMLLEDQMRDLWEEFYLRKMEIEQGQVEGGEGIPEYLETPESRRQEAERTARNMFAVPLQQLESKLSFEEAGTPAHDDLTRRKEELESVIKGFADDEEAKLNKEFERLTSKFPAI